MSQREFPPEDLRIDEAIAESFPASDPPSYYAGISRAEEKTMRQREESSSTFGWVLGSFALGAVCGLLLAPKKGTELIEDIGDWSREQGERGRDLYARAKEYIPHRARRAAGMIREKAGDLEV